MPAVDVLAEDIGRELLGPAVQSTDPHIVPRYPGVGIGEVVGHEEYFARMARRRQFQPLGSVTC